MKTRNSKLFRWALWWGIGIVVVSLAILLSEAFISMGDTSGVEPSGNELDAPIVDYLYRIVYKFGIWPMFIFIGVIAPIYEELIFRGWGNGKKWTGFISVVLISLFSATFGWWVGLITIAAGIAIMVIFDSDLTKRLFALMLFSSLVFALIHIGNYNSSENLLIFIVGILHKFGMGLLASYLVINHNILWAMGFHILNNSVFVGMIGYGFSMIEDKTTVIETDDYRITSKTILYENQIPDGYDCVWVNDSVFYHIATPDFSTELFINSNNTSPFNVISEWKFYPKMEIKVEMLGGSQNYDAVVRAIEKEGWIALDTVGDTIHIRSTYNPLENFNF